MFDAMATQWNVGLGGAVGLRYESLPLALRIVGVEATPELYSGVRLMERVALEVMRDGR